MGQGVAQQTKNFADVTRLNSTISDKEQQMAQLYQSIGLAYYQRHQTDETSEFQTEMEEIKRLQTEIAQAQEEIKQIRGITKCPNCGADVPFQASFCNCCGTKLTAPISKPAPTGGQHICPACGAACEADNLFCIHCGTKLN